MSNILSLISGPLDKSSCAYFLIITVFFFLLLVVAFFANLFVLLRDRKNLTIRNMVGGIYMLFNRNVLCLITM